MEGSCGRPVIWATAQYLSYARPRSVLDLHVRVAVQGRNTSQARLTAHVGDSEILTVNAALGERPGDERRQWVHAPAAPPPEACVESARWDPAAQDLHSRIEVRLARGSHDRTLQPDGGSPDGRLVMWIRPRRGEAIDASMLAIMADHIPSAVGAALGRNAGGNSLDNTIRMMGVVPTQWVLCDATIAGVSRGMAHGAMRLYAQDGTLMATASQSIIVRSHDRAEVSASAADPITTR
jgi:acyl-CoA thioesterase